MTEEFLYYIWKFGLFEKEPHTSCGKKLQIINRGTFNSDAGPDFFNARIKIGNTTWAGNVEVHLNSSDWHRHSHNKNKSFDNIILHVVYNNDKEIKRNNGEIIPTFELKDKFDLKLYNNYRKFMESSLWVPCANQLKNIDNILLRSYFESLLVERLEKKYTDLKESLKLYNNNWEQLFYVNIARNFGFKSNAVPFELLAKSLPISYLAKHKNNLLQVEALLFGQAGLLDGKFNDDYSDKLKNEYKFLRQKFSLNPIDKHLWKFLRLRPSNFPTIRIAQFAELIHRSSGLFSKTLECRSVKQVEKLFSGITCSEYWQSHFTFDKVSVKHEKNTGRDAVNLIIINTIAPVLFLYGKEKNDDKYKDRAIKFLMQITGEKNSIINKWQEAGVKVNSAFDTQALLELKNSYCNFKKCLNCRIGNYLLKKSN